MKHATTAGFLTLVLCLAVAHAQPPRMGAGVALVGQFPVGDFAEAAAFGLGGLAGVEAEAARGLTVTARSGYIQHFEKNDRTYRFIPIFGGAKTGLPETGLYVAGELGPVLTRIEYTGSNLFNRRRTDETRLGWSVGAGSALGPADVRASLHVWDAGRMSESMTLGLSLGLTVWRL